MKLLTFITTFFLIIIAELGDKTQIATLIFASNNPHKKWQILLGASLALIVCVTVEITIGLTLAKYLSPKTINKIAGVIFLSIGFFIFYSLIKKSS